jgi:putative polyketide hydroxylase
MNADITAEVPVLIVGGGPVGLTASILLSQEGVRSLLVERHPGTAVHPKARGINGRTMEMYRQHGVEAAIRKAGLAPEHTGLIVWTRTLSGEEIERRIPWRAGPQSAAVSPVRNCLCAQDDLEPVLRAFAEQQEPAALRFSTEVIACEQDADGVTATLVDRVSGTQTRLRASYVIAADGAQSALRRQLGVRMLGHENVYESVNILLNADLRPWTTQRPAALYFVENPKLRATFLTINGFDRWGFLVNNLSAYGYKPGDFTPERSAELVRIAVGVDDLDVKILGIAPWTASAHVAEQYRHGRIFLAGDAAHEMPPTGGFGMNTGVQDVHNLAWKLAAVLHGVAGPALLDTYHDERQPFGRIITEQALNNSISMGRLEPAPGTVIARPEFLNEQGMIFGATYTSAAVVSDGTALPVLKNPVTDYVPSARPGGRAPHVWLARDGMRISTIDLFGDGFVLLTGIGGKAWSEAARRLAAQMRLNLTTLTVGDGELGDPEGQWADTYGVDETGAVLVRPDGYVGWRSRSMTSDPGTMLGPALTRILGGDDSRYQRTDQVLSPNNFSISSMSGLLRPAVRSSAKSSRTAASQDFSPLTFFSPRYFM